ncbi:RagB/SusD family nutrient uptake outer membrane protein [Flavitalea sp. BT771]|uniref:RagB/SusD family nutrient uptake outer membrane protein n=1 Tax=Flavitalea sp. BT771 TaxID=3063329 RepID=UPI0026E25812|nr:RagB/SusD family nutrient uptake outer membrane protein [Flavitalea sp. BT771]MDO6434110.1 RagB/SusD family nutrient uptake outer membrane protein [Flavitalea sp. BT771]MDV6223010.1 RagB/SusD family nutrient uptake outer membrane protein [Flavitalea sp. BT771]
MFNNKYRLTTIYLGLTLAVLFGACKKSFIDGNLPTDSGDRAQVFASVSSVRSYFTGIYRNLRLQWQSTDGSAGGTDDCYSYNSICLARAIKGKDLTMARQNWFIYDYANANREPTYRRVRFTWYYFYELINQVNILIDGTQSSTTIADADKATIIAEARAMRAFFYFELAREFQLAYSKDPNAPGVPIYTTPATTSTPGNPRGTLQQTFDQINGDIAYALQHLGASRNLKDQININVAWGLAARIYLEQGKWAEAQHAAEQAIDGYALDASHYRSNYKDMASPEVIWGLPQTTSNGGQSLYYGTPSSFYDQTRSGYDAFYISLDLVQNFSATDVRNTFFQSGSDPSGPDYAATNKFGKGSGQGVQLFTGEVVEQRTTDLEESINLMRVAEMYLVDAEAMARQNDDADAHDVLFALQSDRDVNAVRSTNTGQALIDEILLERRKELYGELGVDWLDAKRLQLPIDRTNSNHAAAFAYVIPANDPRFNLKIPQAEMQANKSLKPGDQNP